MDNERTITYDIRHGRPLRMDHEYAHCSTIVQFQGFTKQIEDSTVYLCMGAPLQLMVPLTDDYAVLIVQTYTRRAGTFKCQLLEAKLAENSTDTYEYMRYSDIFHVIVTPSLAASSMVEVTDPRLELVYTQMHEAYLRILSYESSAQTSAESASASATAATTKAGEAASSATAAATSASTASGAATTATTKASEASASATSAASSASTATTKATEAAASATAAQAAVSEVTGIRVGADGTTYSTAGDAVRGQISDLKEDLGILRITNYPKANGVPNATGWDFTGSTSYQHIAIPVNGGDIIDLVTNASQYTYFAAVASYNGTGTAPDYCATAPFTARINVSNGLSRRYTLPSDAKYIVYCVKYGNNDATPQALKINGFDICESIYDNVVNDNIDNTIKFGDQKILSIDAWEKGYGAPGTSAWDLTNPKYVHSVIPVKNGDKVEIYSGQTSTTMAVLKSYTGNATPPNYCATAPFNAKITLSSNARYVYTIPADAKYIAYLTLSNNVNVIPRSFKINGYEYCKSASSNIGEISDEIASSSNANNNNVIYPYLIRNNLTSQNVTFAWNWETLKCNVVSGSGGASASTFNNIINETLPTEMEIGHTYYVRYVTSDTHVDFRVMFYDASNNMISFKIFTEDGYITVPNGAVKIICRFFVSSGASVNGVISEYAIYKYKPEFLNPVYIGNNPKIIVFKDDDTINDEAVQKYRDACLHNGIVGTYATLTGKITNGDTSAEKLLQFEQEGFSVITHCNQQLSDDYWTQGHLDPQLQRQDMATAIKVMRENGFINPMYWQTPGGIFTEDILNTCKSYGFKSLGTTSFGTAAAAINPIENIHRYNLYVYSMKENDSYGTQTLAGAKQAIDLLSASNGGLLIITTHFYDWSGLSWDSTLDANGYPIGYARFNELAQYAKDSGCPIMNYANAVATLEPYFAD